jgi:hypothetical protein
MRPLQSACKPIPTHEQASRGRIAPTVRLCRRATRGAFRTHPVSPRPRLFCFPSSDSFFAAIVEEVARELALDSPDELVKALRPLYPQISVHPRRLEGESGTVWYVYRERTFPAHPGDVD